MLRPCLIGMFDKDRTRISRRRQDTLRRLALRPVIEGMEARIAPATRVWSGAVDALWSTPGNWDVAPDAGDDLVFPSTATGFVSSNDLTAGMNFKSITISGSGYTLSGNALSLTDGLSATYTSGTSDDGIPTDIGAGAVSVAEGGTLRLNGILSGSAGLTLTGGGTLALSAANVYSGPTAVNAGVLRVDGSIPGAVSLAIGTVLTGIGSTGAVSSTGGTVSPGNATPGTLLVADATFDGTSTFSARLDGNTPGNGVNHYDQLSTPGDVTLSNAFLSLTLGGTYTPAAGDALVLIDNTGTNPVGGTFNGLPEGSLVSVGVGQIFRISYQGGTGNDVVLNFVQDSTTTLTSSVNPSVFGELTTITATVTAAVGTPTGTVDFYDGATLLGSGTLDAAGQAAYAGTLGVGSHSITAVYNGDSSNNSSTSSPLVQTVAQASTATTVVAAPNPSVLGQAVTITATVAALPPGAGTPTGTVDFFDGATLLGSGTLDASGQASLTTSALGTGVHAITAVYGGDSDFTGSTAPVISQAVDQAATTTTVIATPDPSVFGQAVTIGATVAPVAPGAGVPTGTVDFFDGATLLGSGTLDAAGQAFFTTTVLSTGAHSITAVYSGDVDFTGSTSPLTNQVVNQAATATTVVAAPNPSLFGQSVTITATVAALPPGAGTPTGTVDFFDGATLLGSGTLDASGQASLTTTLLGVGAHAITAVYGGDSDFTGSTSLIFTQAVDQAATTTTVVTTPNPSVFGQSVTFTATVTVLPPGAGVPTGTVSFFDGAALLGTSALDGAGQATLATSILGVGVHSVIAVYNGDADFLTSSSVPGIHVVSQAATTTAVTAAPNPSVFGQAVTIGATVAPVAPGAGVPTGTVDFYDGATLLGSGTLDAAGLASLTTSALGVGTHAITAVYSGDVDFAGSTAPVLTQVITQADTTTTVVSAPNPSVFGEAVTFTATVTAVAPGAGVPTGTVDFFDGATLLGSGTLDASGQASLTTAALGVGAHAITAVYGGDADFTGSTATADTHIVDQAATTTTVVGAPNPSVFGQAVTITATVAALPPGAGTPTGTVSFFDGATLLGTSVLDASGQASLTTTALGVGAHSITAVYGGDTDFAGSTAVVFSQVVNQAATATTVVSAPNPSVFGQSVTFTATVTALPPGAGTPTGTVDFFDGATLLGSGPLDASGQASLTTAALGVGAHAITAVYSGDSDFTGSTSLIFTQAVDQAATTTTVVSAPNPSVFGEAVTFTATVTTLPPGAGVPTGIVSFFDGATLLGSGALDASGQISLTTTVLGAGAHSITAVYGGDSDFTGSTAAVLTQVVNQASVQVTVVGSPSPSSLGQPVTFTATVAAALPGAGTPTGTVDFFDGATLLGTGTLDASGLAAFTTSGLTFGVHSITAVYSGDDNFQPNTSPAFNQIVGDAASITSLTGSINPTVFGQSVTFTAVVSPAIPAPGTPTGTIDFYDGATLLGSATLDGTGTATFTTSTLSVGGHSITAVYAGDGFFLPSTSPAWVQGVNRADTAATIGGSGSPTLFGQPVTVTTTVSASAPGSGVPTGTVQLLDGATVIATSTLDGTGTATFVVTTLSVGVHNLSVAYLGDTGFNATTSSTLVQQIDQASTGTALTSSSATSVSGQSVTLTAAVTPVAPAGGVPTGSVAFFDGATLLGTVPLDASGVAQLTLANLGVGAHSITAVYGGDADFTGSTSPVLSQTVNKADAAGTLTASVGAPVAGQPVTFVFTVAAVAPGAGLPTGNVTFFDGATALGTAALSGGVATFTTTSLAVGAHSITAVYAGNGNFNGATSAPLSLSVAKEATVTTIAAPLTTTVFGQWIGFTATVSAVAPGGVLPAGTVTFYDGATPLGTVPTVGGVATFIATSLTVGSHAITAVYAGGARTLPSNSSTFNLNVVKNNAVISVTAEDAVFGRPTLVTATLSAAAPGAGKPTNVVNFLDNNVVVATAWVVNGVAQASLNLSPGGSTHTLTVAYLGDNNYNPVLSSPLVRTVAPADTTTGLVTVPIQNSLGTWLVAAVTPSTPNAGVAAGTVTFSVDGIAFSNQTLVNGWAMVYLGPIGVNHTYTARYNGNSNLKPSTSPQVFLGMGALRAAARPMAALAARGVVKANGYPSALGF